jgi:hypothetical protein
LKYLNNHQQTIMKKLLLVLMTCMGLAAAMPASAQLAAGSIAPDFTARDIKGNIWHLYELLDSGKTVIIDISATWCGPCWNYHSSGVLEDVYNLYGPNGTNEMMVFWVEGESQNTTSQMYGPALTSGTAATVTQGDWVSGTTFPMIDDACKFILATTGTSGSNLLNVPNAYRIYAGMSVSGTGIATGTVVTAIDSANNQVTISQNTTAAVTGNVTFTGNATSIGSLYNIGYFPTIYMICPDRIVREVGQLSSSSAFYTNKSNECFIANDANDAGITNSMNVLNGVLASCNTVDVSYRLCNYGTAPLTSATIDLAINGAATSSYNWTGNLNTYQSVVLTFSGVNGNTGTNAVTVTTSNPNGSADPVAGNDSRNINVIKYGSVGGAMSPQNFALATFPPSGWLQITSASSSGPVWLRSTAGNAGAGSAKADFYNAPSGDQDALQLPQLDLTLGSSPYLTFDVSHAQYSSTYSDNLKVKVSTNCGATWIQLYNKSGATLATTTATTSVFTPTTAAQWRKDTVYLTNYATNQNVFVKFEANSAYGNNLYLDNVNLAFGTTGIGNVSMPVNFEVYPNPAADRASVDFSLDTKENISIEVMNNIGEIVYSRNEKGLGAGDYTFDIPTSELSSGIYMVNVRTNEGSSLKKLIVK